MSIHLGDDIQTGWEVFARDGSRAGTVSSIHGDELQILLDEGQAERTVPRNLVMEAVGGRVHLDMAPEELGMERTETGSQVPTRDPGAPPKAVSPDQIRRVSSG